MLTFLFGRPGSGKTQYIIEKIKDSVNKRKKTYFLVPEQQTYISECMLADLPESSALCFEIVTFSRICELVFGKYGGLTDKSVSTADKHLTMWLSLREAEGSGNLQKYQGIRSDSSLCQLMLSTVNELRANSVTPEICAELSKKCKDPDLSKKLADIALIYELFNSNLKSLLGDSALASEDRLSRLALLLSKNDFFEGCNFYVDSFTSFTAIEQEILKEIFKQADNSIIALSFDAQNSKAPHIESLVETAKAFISFADKKHIEYEKVRLGKNRRTSSPELISLEENLWNFSVTTQNAPEIPENERGAIQTAICKNEYEEIQFAALSILDAHNRGIDFSEIALIMRDADSRKGLISSVFEKMRIPYFLSEKIDLSQTPAARFILSALRCVAYNFRLQDVMTLLKTGLCGIDDVDVDIFENYCRAWKINGSLFLEDKWSMNPDGYTIDRTQRSNKILNDVNRIRPVLINPLKKLRDGLWASDGDIIKICRSLYNYLNDTDLSENLSKVAKYELENGRVKDAGELIRVYDCINSAIAKICNILANTKITVEDLICAIEIMLKHTDIASIPLISDYVTVGSADMLRVENVKMAILIGLCEGEFPAGYSDNGILCEADKEILESTLGLSLSSRENRVISDELFYVYRAMTKPSEHLILCTSTSRIGGGSFTPSTAFNRVKQLFPYINDLKFEFDRVKESAFGAKNYTTENEITVDPLFVRQIFGDKITLTKTKISTFAECPYKFWCDYVLKLRDQKISEVSYSHSGTIVHYVLEKFLSKFVLEDGSLPEISYNDMLNEVNQLVKNYFDQIGCPTTSTVMFTFSRLRDLSVIMVSSVLQEFKKSQFKILAFEKAISESTGSLKPLIIKLGDGDDAPVVSLEGIIDRIDCYENENIRYLRVVDYKTGTHKFDTSKIADGNDLQLPAYLFTAAMEENSSVLFDSEKEVYPASALFLSADESEGKTKPVRSGFILCEDEILRATNNELDKSMLAGIQITKKDNKIKGNAAVNRNDIDNINNTLINAISNVGKNIYSGNIPKTPSKTSCEFCMFKSSCPSAED